MDERNREHELRSYGRRRGRALSARQAALLGEALARVSMPSDALLPRDLRALFTPPASDVWLEIGFGGGEHLLWQAQQHPQVGFIGCEPFQNGVVKVLSTLESRHNGNVRIHIDDARPLLRLLPDGGIGRAFILFPDPWPKKRHQKRRLVCEPTLAELARILRPGAELRIATDIGEHARWILLAARAQGGFRWSAARPMDWRERPTDWPPTRYEQKAIREGRRCYYFRFLRA